MKTSIALVSAALLLGAALARPTSEFRRPAPPKPPHATPPAAAAVEAPEATSFLDTLVAALLPSPEPEPIKEFIGIDSPRYNVIGPFDEFPETSGINRKLETMKIDLAFENTKLEDILAFIRDFSGLNIILDANFRDRIDPEQPITFKVKDLVLKSTLKLLLAPFQLDYRITEEDVVLITCLGQAVTEGSIGVFRRDAESEWAAIEWELSAGREALKLEAAGDHEAAAALRLRFRRLMGKRAQEAIPPAATPFEAVMDAARVDLDVQNWPTSAIVDELRARTGLDLRMRHEDDHYITFKIRDLGLRQALTLLLQPRNLTYEIDGVTIWIRGPRDPDRY